MSLRNLGAMSLRRRQLISVAIVIALASTVGLPRFVSRPVHIAVSRVPRASPGSAVSSDSESARRVRLKVVGTDGAPVDKGFVSFNHPRQGWCGAERPRRGRQTFDTPEFEVFVGLPHDLRVVADDGRWGLVDQLADPVVVTVTEHPGAAQAGGLPWALQDGPVFQLWLASLPDVPPGGTLRQIDGEVVTALQRGLTREGIRVDLLHPPKEQLRALRLQRALQQGTRRAAGNAAGAAALVPG